MDPTSEHDGGYPTNTVYETKQDELRTAKEKRLIHKDSRQNTTKKDLPFYVRKRSRRNQFRPIFQSRQTILQRAKEVDISSVRPRPAPAPPRGSKTKVRKRAQTAKDQKSRASSKKNKDKGKSAPGRRQPRPKRKRRRVGRTRASGEASYKVDPKAATKIDRRYRKNLKTKSLTVGSLQGNIRRTLRNRALENPAQAELVSTVMLDAVRTLQNLRIAVY
ncbi:hypothetical protein BGX33_003353 [Mortierella sp. NVP41]|nr:hypothetical protein BGX33_003353 [Mortierella sp. NVP41]